MTSTHVSKIITALNGNGVLGLDAQAIAIQLNANLKTLRDLQDAWDKRPTVLIAEPDSARFLANFFAAVLIDCPVFLANPAWKSSEWQQVWAQVQPDIVWGTIPEECRLTAKPITLKDAPSPDASAMTGWIMIPTGGTSGRIRFVIHTWQTLMASVEGFRQFFQVDVVNAYCVLPLYHVSGLMQVLRCVASGGTLAIAPFKSMEQTSKLLGEPQDFFLSLVPTQLQRLMRSPTHCQQLAQFRTVLLGGAPAWPDLLDAARSHHIPLAPTYGMTETASQVVTLLPERFLAGHTSVGQVLPHATLSIETPPTVSEAETNEHPVGSIAIQSSSLALGYYPDQWFASGIYRPDDLGSFDEKGELHLIGRSSDKIISGGENIFPAEVEAAIRSTGLVADVAVIGVSDRHWGHIVTAVYVSASPDVKPEAIEHQLMNRLSRYKQPKQWVPVAQLPRNAQGKLNRDELMRRAIALLQHQETQHQETVRK